LLSLRVPQALPPLASSRSYYDKMVRDRRESQSTSD